MALHGMVLDNAFSDVRQLVWRTLMQDHAVNYGTYTDANKASWVFIAPTTPEVGLRFEEAKLALGRVSSILVSGLQSDKDRLRLGHGVRQAQRTIRAFAKRISGLL